jgi:hypothetical protein
MRDRIRSRGYTKKSIKKYNHQYYLANKKKIIKNTKAWNKANKEKMKKWRKVWAKKNVDYLRKKRAEFRIKHGKLTEKRIISAITTLRVALYQLTNKI